ncbi:MAG: hypothetical protein ACYS1A_15135 [Planctomycetota bacterium]|jgi:hypothetical protein
MGMKKPQYRSFVRHIFCFVFFAMVFFHSGCGIVSMLGTPARHEKKIPAEYNLSAHKDEKLLVLVNQPAWMSGRANLRYYLTRAIHKNLKEQIKIAPENLVDYDELSAFRSNQRNFSLLSPVAVGKALGADIVLLAAFEDFQLNEMAKTGIYKGFLSVRAVVLGTSSGEKLWPKDVRSKGVKVGFEFEERGERVAVARLMTACAHCTIRYFYDCPMDKFKIADDRSGEAWEKW